LVFDDIEYLTNPNLFAAGDNNVGDEGVEPLNLLLS